MGVHRNIAQLRLARTGFTRTLFRDVPAHFKLSRVAVGVYCIRDISVEPVHLDEGKISLVQLRCYMFNEPFIVSVLPWRHNGRRQITNAKKNISLHPEELNFHATKGPNTSRLISVGIK